ncbi:MAG TPA: hypothetical protein PL123_10780 [Bacteroidales bacterium]|nr:hypothetical protein [Bacteroidales bacterium]
MLLFLPARSQEEGNKISAGGYVTSMQSAMFDSLSGPVIFDNLIHNRLNINAYIGSKITFNTELRNRLFTGDMSRAGNAYSEIIGSDQGLADMSWNLIRENSFFFNTTIDRLWMDVRLDRFEARIGRQRINWGQALVWNPNDIFNAYSFFDFDYVERPGSDAVRIQYFPSSSSAAEIAAKIDSDHDVTAAGLYRFNKWGFDLQFLAGYANSSDLVAGTGLSGAIGSFSLRGEGTLFYPAGSSGSDEGTLLLTAGTDRIFENNSMLQFQFMYCNNPLSITDFNSFYSGNMSAKDLAFSEFTAFGSFTWAANPLLNLTLSAMWFPDLDGYFAGPSIDYSLAENIDFSLIWQHFDSSMNGSNTRINLAYLRLKYSF